MKSLYSLSKDRADRSSGVTHALLGLLLVIGLFQLAICVGPAMQLVAPGEESGWNGRFLELQTNSVQVRGVGAALHQKS